MKGKNYYTILEVENLQHVKLGQLASKICMIYYRKIYRHAELNLRVLLVLGYIYVEYIKNMLLLVFEIHFGYLFK